MYVYYQLFRIPHRPCSAFLADINLLLQSEWTTLRVCFVTVSKIPALCWLLLAASSIKTKKCRRLGWLTNWKRLGRNRLWPNSDIRMEAPRKTTRNLSQDSRLTVRDSNGAPPKYKLGMLPSDKSIRSLSIITCIPVARQRLGKHIPMQANALNNGTSIAKQRRGKHASSTI
jgi:hypothetical protein